MNLNRRNLLLAGAGLALSLASPFGVAAQEKVIRIGALIAASGSTAFMGSSQRETIEMLVDEYNAAGGMTGNKVVLTLYDTEGNGTVAAQQFRRLIDSDQVDVVIGPSTTGESLALMAVANESKVPLVSFAGAESVVNPPTPFVFKVPPTDRIVVKHLLSFMKKRGINSIAVLSSADGYGQAGLTVIKDVADELGVPVMASEEFGPKDTDMTPQVLKVRSSGADALLIWSVNPGPTIILKNAASVGYDKPIFNGYGAASPALIEQAGPAAEGSYVSSMRLLAPQSLAEDDPMRGVVTKLADNYRAKYGKEPTTFIAHPADALSLIAAAVKASGGEVDRVKLAEAMRSGISFAGANGMFNFTDTNHNGLDENSNSMIMLQVKGGEFVVAD
ncbi:branched-chain amino acid transport system substrate-binding protein [Rhizobium petrolearium]|uniref:ABC transporter substrate-binding protein n=2 Tax=Neorhizobium TaxID=1525371 RepID=A0ABV0MEL6_9HYPH|nr:ABC transporter substrate-binding protein [Neorhizobium petrolearium]MBP1848364.1 branched-chain amino acid transport system substrate-binding protein [Neorhizobium petrolearium]MCC2614597.1 ABC transporter substrate-binding protein [Neorhizobium petrolearium]WGI72353.1 ABC transporter substrate-binding protein [Neorhizobium petrolearium]